MTALSRHLQRMSRQSYWAARTVLAWGLAIAAFVIFSIAVPHFFSFGNLYSLVQIFAALALLATGTRCRHVGRGVRSFDRRHVPFGGVGRHRVCGHCRTWGRPDLGDCDGTSLRLRQWLGRGLSSYPVHRRHRRNHDAVHRVGILGVARQFRLNESYTAILELTRPIFKVFSWQSIIELTLVAVIVVAVKVTRWGRFLYATGGDSRKARASGLPVARTLTIAFVICALCTTMVGALQGISLASSTPGANNDSLLQAATAVLIGGISLSGGRGSLVGAVAGAVLLSVVTSGLGIAGISSSTIELVGGAILIGVLAFDRPLARLVHRRTEGLAAAEEDHATLGRRPERQTEIPIETAEL